MIKGRSYRQLPFRGFESKFPVTENAVSRRWLAPLPVARDCRLDYLHLDQVAIEYSIPFVARVRAGWIFFQTCWMFPGNTTVYGLGLEFP